MTEDLDLDRVRAGLRLAHPPDPEQLAAEARALEAVEHAPASQRYGLYARLSGPGFLQSAMTLGSGSAAASLFAGATFGYALLWVAPVGMLLGVIVLSAVAHQTLSTGMRPFEAMRRFAGAPFAWFWAIGALVASIIWHVPQYSLASGCLVDLGQQLGIDGLSAGAMSFVILAWAIAVSWLYGATPRFVRIYERILKYTVWGVIVCFAIVVWNTGIQGGAGALLRGFFGFEIPGERNGVNGFEVVVAGLSAAVGINMVFLYPYSLLARGWGRAHRGLARFDLLTGMLVPYVLAVTLMVIATANTLHLDPLFTAKTLRPVEAAESLASVPYGQTLFLVGVLGMTLSTITLHMLTAGFVCTELFGWPVGGWKYRLATLLPTPAVLAPVFLSKFPIWLAVPTTIVCGLFLPLVYVAFAKLLGSRAYLGDDVPSGWRGAIWRGAIWVATALLAIALILYLRGKL